MAKKILWRLRINWDYKLHMGEHVFISLVIKCRHRINNCQWIVRRLFVFLYMFQTYHSLHEVLVSFGRRSLCYPLYRHFSLITTAVQDAAHILQGGEFSHSVSFCPSLPAAGLYHGKTLEWFSTSARGQVEGRDLNVTWLSHA